MALQTIHMKYQAFIYCKNNKIKMKSPTILMQLKERVIQWTLVTTIAFVPKDIAIKMNFAVVQNT